MAKQLSVSEVLNEVLESDSEFSGSDFSSDDGEEIYGHGVGSVNPDRLREEALHEGILSG